MNITAIDPGPEQSGWVNYYRHRSLDAIDGSGVLPNERLRTRLLEQEFKPDYLAIEKIVHYGKHIHAGGSTFETAYWTGRFAEAWGDDSTLIRIPRPEIKLHICGSPRAKDSDIIRRLQELIGPKGSKRSPGPTYGVSGHAWAALACAVTAADRLARKAA